MSWGAWILILIYPAVLLLGLSYLTPREIENIRNVLRWAPVPNGIDRLRAYFLRHQRRLEWSNIILGISLGTYTGILLGTLGARALWSSGLLGPLFLVSGLSTGAALFFGGVYTAEFWALVIIAGLLVPLFLEIYELRHKVHAGLVAPVLLLVGGLALRWILVSAGQIGL